MPIVGAAFLRAVSQRPAVRFTRRIRHGCPVRSDSTYCSLYDNQTHCTAKYGAIRGMRFRTNHNRQRQSLAVKSE
jgi:hypothetical protein